MDIARCTEDGKIYSAMQFSLLNTIDFDHLKKGLQCPECNNPVVFQRSSRNYGAPCFRGHPHATGCTLSSQDECADDQDGNIENTIINPNTVIVIDFNYGAQIDSGHVETTVQAPNRSHISGSDYGQPAPFAYRRPGSLLQILTESPAFGQSEQLIRVQGWENIAARDFFVPLLDVTDQYAGLYRAYWGEVSSAGIAPDGALWLNSGWQGNISFCVQTHHLNELARRYSIKKTGDLAGVHVLVFGTPKIARNGKLCCIVADPNCIALRRI